jgi:hypothetical protein
MPCARWVYRRALDELRLHTALQVGVGYAGRTGPVANISIQTRYCTTTTADKPFCEMQNFIG